MPKLLDELERLERAATPGPWAGHADLEIAPLDAEGHHDWEREVAAIVSGRADMVLIVVTRNALPALLRLARAADNGEWHSSEDCRVEGRAATCGLCQALAALEKATDV